MTFVLDPRLERDSAPVAELRLSAVRLMRDANYPWLLLVPRRPAVAELIELSREDRILLLDEVALASQALGAVASCEKLNIAALGNVVRQLHVHVVARVSTDPAWPGPVWGHGPAKPYGPGEEEALVSRLAGRLADLGRTG